MYQNVSVVIKLFYCQIAIWWVQCHLKARKSSVQFLPNVLCLFADDPMGRTYKSALVSSGSLKTYIYIICNGMEWLR